MRYRRQTLFRVRVPYSRRGRKQFVEPCAGKGGDRAAEAGSAPRGARGDICQGRGGRRRVIPPTHAPTHARPAATCRDPERVSPRARGQS